MDKACHKKDSPTNLGFPEFNIEEQLREYQSLKSKIKPDMLVLTIDGDYSKNSACSDSALPVRHALRKVSALWNYFADPAKFPAMRSAWNYSVPANNRRLKVIFDSFAQTDTPSYLLPLTESLMLHRQGGSDISLKQVAEKSGFKILDLSTELVNSGLSRSTAGPTAENIAKTLAVEIVEQISSKKTLEK